MLACPAGTDCMGYVKLIADGDYAGAWERVREKVPFPASIGRVCPRPCEDACRRELVEQSVSIASLKQFVGDRGIPIGTAASPPEPEKYTGKSVAIIGGGPAGLSAAFYLRLKGHSVTIYEAMHELGGMLRYGIPEYRLPKDVLQKEIDLISDTGVEFKTNTKPNLDELREKYDAVIVAIGAWSSTGLRCKGEELDGVIGGIDFLRSVTAGEENTAADRFVSTGSVVAVVGGGNTAMDACRTAVRLGAEKVYCIYRRTRDEMPAQDIEISEAMEEGVIFKFLTNPIEIIGNGGEGSALPSVKSMRLRIMELGEPDSSGRRKPVETEDEELLEVDTVISAIGQKPKLDGFESLETTEWGTIIANEQTFKTNIGDVFAIGDATNKGADIAVSAIGEGGRCAEIVNRFLSGKVLGKADSFMSYIVKDEKTPEDFADYEKLPRVTVNHRSPEERAKDFKEVYSMFGDEAAKKEAKRCIECGCSAYVERNCKLIWYANQCGVEPARFAGLTNTYSISDNDHDEIARNPEKCVLCGLCVRVCEQVEGVTALGFAGRGFNTTVKPALDKLLKDTTCNSCGKCYEICPTGALCLKDTTTKKEKKL